MNPDQQKFLFPFVLTLYFVSGLTSLAYEVMWARMLSLQFGVSIFGVVITVTVFMFGLGAGSLLGTRLVHLAWRPLIWFAIFEGVIGLLALTIPHVFQSLDGTLSGLAVNTGAVSWYLLQFLVTGLILLVPALLMGATFPFVLAVFPVRSGTLAYFYGVNTLGAALGALIPLLLLPAIGWISALTYIASTSLLVALLAMVTALILPEGSDKGSSQSTRQKVPVVNLVAYAGIGAASLILEIAWTRLFGMLFLRTEYVLAIILAVFLVGIGIGSIISRFLVNPVWFNLLPMGAALLAIASLWLLPYSGGWVDSNTMASLSQALVKQGLVIALLTLPITVIFGAWLPLLNRRLGNMGMAGAQLYGANALGAAVGAVSAGFLLTPKLGSSATIVFASVLLMLCSLAWVRDKKFLLLFPVILFAGIPVSQMPPVNRLKPAVYANTTDIYKYEDAINVTHVVERDDGQRILLADLQRMDASSDPTSVESQRNQSRLPLLLHANPQSVLFLGLGTGISASATKSYPGLQRTAVEISRGAIQAASSFFDKSNREITSDTQVIRDDARHYLMSTDQRFDVIIGDLFHPDLVGRSALLSTQQFERVKSRLNNQGVFVQWLALNQFDVESTKIILRTFKKVFPDSVLFLDAFRLALVGGSSGLSADELLKSHISRLSEEQLQDITGGEGFWTWMGRYWGTIPDSDGVIQDEWRPQIEFRLPGERYTGGLDLSRTLEFMLSFRPHVNEAAKQLHVIDAQFKSFERSYIGTDLAHRSWLALLYQQASEGQRLLKLAYQANPNDKWIGFAVADASLQNFDNAKVTEISEQALLESVLKIRPDHPEVLKRLWLLEQDKGNRQNAAIYFDRLRLLSPYDISLRPYSDR